MFLSSYISLTYHVAHVLHKKTWHCTLCERVEGLASPLLPHVLPSAAALLVITYIEFPAYGASICELVLGNQLAGICKTVWIKSVLATARTVPLNWEDDSKAHRNGSLHRFTLHSVFPPSDPCFCACCREIHKMGRPCQERIYIYHPLFRNLPYLQQYLTPIHSHGYRYFVISNVNLTSNRKKR